MRRHRVVLVRHGESDWNREGRFQGQGGTGLTERGRAQAVATAAYLARRERDVVGVVRSDLRRVAETAGPALSVLSVPETVSSDWREIDVGWWSGLTHDEVAAADPEGYAAWQRGDDLPRGEGETFAALTQRVRGALDTLVDTHPPGTVLVFTHGGCVHAAAMRALGESNVPGGGLGEIENCSVTSLHGGSRGWQLLAYNETAHLVVAD